MFDFLEFLLEQLQLRSKLEQSELNRTSFGHDFLVILKMVIEQLEKLMILLLFECRED
jgi:hypothetical protein